MAAAAHPPVEYYTFFLKSLLETVRINIGECAAASYSTLTIAAATKLFMFDNEKVRTLLLAAATYFPNFLSICRRKFYFYLIIFHFVNGVLIFRICSIFSPIKSFIFSFSVGNNIFCDHQLS